jgi:hypothetical protein
MKSELGVSLSPRFFGIILTQVVFIFSLSIDMNLTVFLTELLGFGLFPSSGILENRKHDVSETGFVSVLR